MVKYARRNSAFSSDKRVLPMTQRIISNVGFCGSLIDRRELDVKRTHDEHV